MTKLSIPGLNIIDELPGGATGRIFRARDGGGRCYVLKLFCPAQLGLEPDEGGFLRPAEHQWPEARRCYELFLREAAVSRELYAQYGGSTNSCWFYRGETLELCPPSPEKMGACILYDTSSGESLASLMETRRLHLEEKGALTALEWTRRIMEALSQMHGHVGAAGEKCPYLHLDIKPSNIYCTDMAPGGDEKLRIFRLLDMGSALPLGDDELSRALRRSIGPALSATAGYAAPELIRAMETGDASALGVKTDMYSVGAVLFELLAGHPYDFDCLEIDSPCVLALPAAARRQLQSLLEKLLESPLRMEPEQLYEALSELTDTVSRRGLSRAVLFDGMRSCLAALPEQPDERLLASVDTKKGAFPNFTAAMGRHRCLCLVGSGMQGKTYSMLHCAQHLTREYGEGLPVPLYIPLRELRNSESAAPISGYIVRRYGGDDVCEDRVFALAQSLKSGRFLILADGLDELQGTAVLKKAADELHGFLELGAQLAVSSRTDPRKDIFAGWDMDICTPLPLSRGRIDLYLRQHGLPPADRELERVLGLPMLLKMYARSEQAAVHSSLLENPALRFVRGSRRPGDIMRNYREYRLAAFLEGGFDEARAALRLMLPYLAYGMCLCGSMKLSYAQLRGEIDHFFMQMQEPEFFHELLDYGSPCFLPEEYRDRLEEYDRDPRRVRRCQLAMNGAFALDVDSLPAGLTAEEMMESLDLGDFADARRDMGLSRRRSDRCMEILSRSGLVELDGSGMAFAHEELKYLFCGEWLLRHARSGAKKLIGVLGRGRLPTEALAYAAELGDFSPCLDKLRGRADLINHSMLLEMDPECDLLDTAPFGSEAGMKNLMMLEIMERAAGRLFGETLPRRELDRSDLHRIAALADHCLHPTEEISFDTEEASPDFSSLWEDEEDIDGEEDDGFIGISPRACFFTDEDGDILDELRRELEDIRRGDLGMGDLGYLSPALTALVLQLPDSGGPEGPIPARSYVELRRILRGSVSMANANLLEIVCRSAPLAGADLSLLDLSAARLADKELQGCSLRGSRLYGAQLLGWLDMEMTHVAHMAYGLSGRYLYVLDSRAFRGFDMGRRACVFCIDRPFAWFWLDEKSRGIVLCGEKGDIMWLDCFTGRVRYTYDVELCSTLQLSRVMGNDDVLMLEDHSRGIPRTLRIDFDENGEAKYSPWREGSVISRADRQNQLRFDPTLRLGRAEGTGRWACCREGTGRVIWLGREDREYLSMAASLPAGKAALCHGSGIEEYDLATGELICSLPGFGAGSLEGTDLRGLSPALAPEYLARAKKLGAII